MGGNQTFNGLAKCLSNSQKGCKFNVIFHEIPFRTCDWLPGFLYKSPRYNLTFHLNVTLSFSGNFIGPNIESITIGPLRLQQYWMYYGWPKVCKFNNLWVEIAIQYIYFGKNHFKKIKHFHLQTHLGYFPMCLYLGVCN